jgi:hypothetical protein
MPPCDPGTTSTRSRVCEERREGSRAFSSRSSDGPAPADSSHPFTGCRPLAPPLIPAGPPVATIAARRSPSDTTREIVQPDRPDLCASADGRRGPSARAERRLRAHLPLGNGCALRRTSAQNRPIGTAPLSCRRPKRARADSAIGATDHSRAGRPPGVNPSGSAASQKAFSTNLGNSARIVGLGDFLPALPRLARRRPGT